MKFKILIIFILFFLFNCRSVENWDKSPVFTYETIESGRIYLDNLSNYNNSLSQRKKIESTEDVSIEELNEQYELEKRISIESQLLASSWFNFYLDLRQDIGFNQAYKGHYYFRKAIDTLIYSEKRRSNIENSTVSDSKRIEGIKNLENLTREAIAQLVVYNSSNHNTSKYYSEIRKLYKFIH